MNVAVVIDDRYYGFFEPFLHEFDCVITMGTMYNINNVKSLTCVMTTRVVQYTPFIKALTLYQTEQLSREREINRVVYEIQEANQRNVKLTILDYSKANMRILQNRVQGLNLTFDHVYAPVVTPIKEKLFLSNLLKSMTKHYDFAYVMGMSTRRQKVKDALEKKGFTVKHIENSFSLERDVYTAQCKYLLNIHADDDFQIFETARCMRWLDAGMTVVTEPSLDLEHYESIPNLKIVPFEDILEGNIFEKNDWIESITSAWKGHRAFADWLVKTIQPKTIVDLGVDYGYSTFVFQKALVDHKIDGLVYGLDLFFGDESTGIRDTYQQVLDTIKKRRLTKLKILRGDFGSLATLWSKPIQILHIDGSHLYENVRENFYSWIPYMDIDGIVLFHDTNVDSPLFGVKRFFDELNGFKLNFPHSSGLGIFTKNEKLYTLIKETYSHMLLEEK